MNNNRVLKEPKNIIIICIVILLYMSYLVQIIKYNIGLEINPMVLMFNVMSFPFSLVMLSFLIEHKKYSYIELRENDDYVKKYDNFFNDIEKERNGGLTNNELVDRKVTIRKNLEQRNLIKKRPTKSKYSWIFENNEVKY